MGGAARFVRTLIPRGRYLPFGSCPCRSRGFDIWRPPAMQGHGGFATPTAEAAPPTSPSPDFPELRRHSPAANAVGLPSPLAGEGWGGGYQRLHWRRLRDCDREYPVLRRYRRALRT